MTFESFAGRVTQLGSLSIVRALPARGRRMVGPWCFLDRFGPMSFADGKPMDVAPHPHIGLQTVSWLLDGEILHHDSLGYEALVRAGGVNIMTSGRGISHSEESPQTNSGQLNGVQLWVALPDRNRQDAASLQHLEQVPVGELRGGRARVFSGSLAGVTSPARHFSEIVGADITIYAGEALDIELQPAYEHAVFVLDGKCSVNRQSLDPGTLYLLESKASEIRCSSRTGGRLLLIGGPPFPESIVMWWNFVARTHEEIAEARTQWQERHDRFGVVRAYAGERLEAPELTHVVLPKPGP